MNIFFKEEKGDRDTFFTAAVVTVTLFFACLPLFTVNCIQGHDIDYHLLRIEALKTGIQNGLPFLRVNMLFFGGEGYASSLFYPDFLLYIPALLRTAGAGINISYHIFVAFCIAAAFAAMYFSARYITGNRNAALISAVVYTLCQYHIDDIYTRAAVGEFTAFIFLPLIAAGLYDLTDREFHKPWILVSGMAGVLLCHTLSTVFSVIFCVAFVLFRIASFAGDRKRLVKLMAAAFVSVLLTMFYWLPVLEQMITTKFKYRDSVFDVGYEKLLIREVFENSSGRMGIAVFVLLFAAFLIRHRDDEMVKLADIFTGAGLVFVLCTTGLFPWKRFADRLSAIQFPWRLFIMACLLFSLAVGIYVEKAAGIKKKAAVIAVLSVMVISAVSNLNRTEEGYYSYSDDYYDEVKFTKSVIGGEWLPSAVLDRDKLGKERNTAFDAEGRAIPVTRKGNTLFISGIESEYVDVPFVYYRGYGAVDESGKELSLNGSGENGRIRVETGDSRSIRVFYKGTLPQKTGDIVSVLTAVILLAVFLILKFRCEQPDSTGSEAFSGGDKG